MAWFSLMRSRPKTKPWPLSKAIKLQVSLLGQVGRSEGRKEGRKEMLDHEA